MCQQEQVSALECEFPVVEVSQVAEHESWRKEINRPLYHIHKWWATRLGSVFRAITLAALSPAGSDTWKAFYRCHHFAGKVVLDPFMGSGTTLGEAVKLGAKAIGSDINPVSTFLVRQALARVPEKALCETFDHLSQTIAPEIRRYYQTLDPVTGETIPILYSFWVKLVQTPDGEIIPLFSRYVFAQDAYPKKKPKAQIVCPECWEIVEDFYSTTTLVCPQCKTSFDPQKGKASGQYVMTRGGKRRIVNLLPADGSPPMHRLYAILAIRPNGEKIYLKPTQADHILYEEAEARLREENIPLPTLEVRAGHNTDQARGYNYFQWRDFFNARQLLCLGLLLREILRLEDHAIQEQMLCLFSSILEYNNIFCSYKGEGTGAVRPLFSNHILKPERMPLENSVWGSEKSSGTFHSLFKSRLIRAKRYLDEPFEVILNKTLPETATKSSKTIASGPIDIAQAPSWKELDAIEKGVLILNGDSSNLPIPDASVDAVVTDPPYFDFVHYSELSDFFFAWLSPALKNRYAWFDKADSSSAGEVQHKDPRAFARLLSLVFVECHRVLKDDGTLAFSFHHSREEGWAAIYEAIVVAGFKVVAAHPVHAEFRASTPKTASSSPISLDAIIVCRKQTEAKGASSDINCIVDKALLLAQNLVVAGMQISSSDRFVVAASQTLISASEEQLTFEQIKSRLITVRQCLDAKAIHMMSPATLETG